MIHFRTYPGGTGSSFQFSNKCSNKIIDPCADHAIRSNADLTSLGRSNISEIISQGAYIQQHYLQLLFFSHLTMLILLLDNNFANAHVLMLWPSGRDTRGSLLGGTNYYTYWSFHPINVRGACINRQFYSKIYIIRFLNTL